MTKEQFRAKWNNIYFEFKSENEISDLLIIYKELGMRTYKKLDDFIPYLMNPNRDIHSNGLPQNYSRYVDGMVCISRSESSIKTALASTFINEYYAQIFE